MEIEAPKTWNRVDGSVVSCTESVKVLNENWKEATVLLQEMYEDAVLLGCGKEAIKAEFHRLIEQLECDYVEKTQPEESKGKNGGR